MNLCYRRVRTLLQALKLEIHNQKLADGILDLEPVADAVKTAAMYIAAAAVAISYIKYRR